MCDDAQGRFELPEPGPMLPPVPAVVLGVKGDGETADDLTVVWTFVLNGKPPQIGVSVSRTSAISGKGQVALGFLESHGDFTLNVLDAEWVKAFDTIDMCASDRADKFEKAGLTRFPSKTVSAPGIAEAAIILECRVFASHPLPPARTIFAAEVARTTVAPGVTDASGRLLPDSRPLFGMAAGCGEFWTLGKKVGYIGMTRGPSRIRY
ncbi:MAG: flavin reductase family protein [Planctomycetota bacterium]|jgi:flavin reductase (DIM6/NTAB) family NADH-FMN oxidoreductase RutF